MITGNKGEWSELYTFLKVLDDKKLYFADANLNKTKDFFSVIGVLREEATETNKFYKFNDDKIEIIDVNEKELGIVDGTKIKSCINGIFKKMKESKGAFSIPAAEEIMKDLKCTQIRAGNSNKADLIASVREQGSPMVIDLGFSIKSMLGGAATLLNASGATNFIYEIKNLKGDYKKINKINTKSKVRDRIRKIEESDGEVIFSALANERFKGNLKKIDVIFVEILSAALKGFYEGRFSSLVDTCVYLEKDQTLKNKYDLSVSDFEYKIKLFLRAVALGMFPNKNWDGLNAAHGGYLIVKENGDIVCYHLYNIDDFQEYLFRNTKFETPSTSRHGFGEIYKKDEKLFINLNLQIRFIK